MIRYIAKPDTWFDEGTEVELVANCGPFGIFRGMRNGSLDEESCWWEEFEIIDD